MNRSITDILEDYVESLVNLPSEFDNKMNELGAMEEEFQRHRGTFRKQKRAYLKSIRNGNNKLANASGSPTTPSPASHLTANSSTSFSAATASATTTEATSLDLIEKEYKAAIDIQDQKINTTKKLYDRLSMHIEQLDFQLAQIDLSTDLLCDQGMHHHHDQQRFPYDYSDVSSSCSSPSAPMNHLQNTYQRPVCSAALENPSPSPSSSSSSSASSSRYHRQISTRKHSYNPEGNRKITSSRRTTGFRKSTHYTPITERPANIAIMQQPEVSPNEPRYCYCDQVSYGDMIACDNEKCEKEWFHYGCVGLEVPPVGKWFCADCSTN